MTTRFSTGTVGIASPGDLSTPVCMQCDTRLRLEEIPQTLQEKLEIGAVEEATFVRLERGPFHDGVKFAGGAEITLQELQPGVTAIVTMLLEGVEPLRHVSAAV